MVAAHLAWNTFECNIARSLLRFCRAWARLAIMSVVERMESGGESKYEASVMLKGRSGWVPVTAKYGEQPMRFCMVIRSAQKMEYATEDHLDWSPPAAL